MTRNELVHTIFNYTPMKGCVKILKYQGKMCLIIKNSGSLDLTDKNISNWSHIKKILDKTAPTECGICLTTELMTSHTVCSECGNGICCGCFSIGILSNKGIAKCAFCRRITGEECCPEAPVKYVIDRKIFLQNPIFDKRIDEFVEMKMIQEAEANADEDSDDEDDDEQDEEENYFDYNHDRNIDGYSMTEYIEYIDDKKYEVKNYGDNVWYMGITHTMGHLPYNFIKKYADDDESCERAKLIVKEHVLPNLDIEVICVIDDETFTTVMTNPEWIVFNRGLGSLKTDTQCMEYDQDEYESIVRYRHNSRKMLVELTQIIETSYEMPNTMSWGRRGYVFNQLRVVL